MCLFNAPKEKKTLQQLKVHRTSLLLKPNHEYIGNERKVFVQSQSQFCKENIPFINAKIKIKKISFFVPNFNY